MSDMEDESWKRNLTANLSFLTTNLVVNAALLTQLKQHSVLENWSEDKITRAGGDMDKVNALIKYLQTRPIKDFMLFLKALMDTNQEHVAKRLDRAGAILNPVISDDSESIGLPIPPLQQIGNVPLQQPPEGESIRPAFPLTPQNGSSLFLQSPEQSPEGEPGSPQTPLIHLNGNVQFRHSSPGDMVSEQTPLAQPNDELPFHESFEDAHLNSSCFMSMSKATGRRVRSGMDWIMKNKCPVLVCSGCAAGIIIIVALVIVFATRPSEPLEIVNKPDNNLTINKTPCDRNESPIEHGPNLKDNQTSHRERRTITPALKQPEFVKTEKKEQFDDIDNTAFDTDETQPTTSSSTTSNSVPPFLGGPIQHGSGRLTGKLVCPNGVVSDAKSRIWLCDDTNRNANWTTRGSSNRGNFLATTESELDGFFSLPLRSVNSTMKGLYLRIMHYCTNNSIFPERRHRVVLGDGINFVQGDHPVGTVNLENVTSTLMFRVSGC